MTTIMTSTMTSTHQKLLFWLKPGALGLIHALGFARLESGDENMAFGYKGPERTVRDIFVLCIKSAVEMEKTCMQGEAAARAVKRHSQKQQSYILL